MYAIIRRELGDVLSSPKAAAARLILAFACSLLVLLRWPTGEVSELSGERSLQVLRIFGYGTLAGVLLLVPAFPATSLVREKVKGTLALLLNSPLSAWSIYLGKLVGSLGFAAVLLLMTIPAAAACQAMGGTVVRGGMLALYGVLALAIVQISTLGLFVSSRTNSPSAALRLTYALVLLGSLVAVAPHVLLRMSRSGSGACLPFPPSRRFSARAMSLRSASRPARGRSSSMSWRPSSPVSCARSARSPGSTTRSSTAPARRAS
jgi:ABC-type transport system involved in multi-copper enzyme maturation permease subunit